MRCWAWAAHGVARPASYLKIFRHPRFGRLTATSRSFAVQAVPGARMVVYIPADETARTAMERLAVGDGMDDRFPCRPGMRPNEWWNSSPPPSYT